MRVKTSLAPWGAAAAWVIAVSTGSAQEPPSPTKTETKAAADAYTKNWNPGAPPFGQFAPRANTFQHIKGDLWRAGDGTWFVGVYVTPAGILLVDTMNPGLIKWLRPQLAQRFPGKPVKYVIYSHTHWDHIDASNAFH